MGNKASKSKGKVSLRVLLLGIASSGKSTFSKQMKIIHCGGFAKEEVENYKEIFHTNILLGMSELVKQAEKANLKLEPDNLKRGRFFKDLQVYETPMESSIAEKVVLLWKDPAIQKTWVNYGCQLVPSMDYLMANMDRSLKKEFSPTETDIVRIRQRTSGTNTSTRITINKNEWILVDVGGQKTERSKWGQIINDGCNAVIFFVSLEEFNVQSTEDAGKSKLQEAFETWKTIINAEEVQQVGVLLFLNKIDLFEKKITNNFDKFQAFFPKYTGGKDVKLATECVKNYFLDAVPKAIDTENIQVEVTCALEKEVMGRIFNTVTEHILMTRVRESAKSS